MHWASLYNTPPPRHGAGILPVLVSITGDLFKLVHFRTPPPPCWHLVAAGTHPAGMLSCFIYLFCIYASLDQFNHRGRINWYQHVLFISNTCNWQFLFMLSATEAQDDDGLPHTLEHIIFMGSEKYPYKVEK